MLSASRSPPSAPPRRAASASSTTARASRRARTCSAPTTPSTPARENMGLGLYLCRQFLRSNGRRTSPTSAPQSGRSLRATLPRSPPPRPAPALIRANSTVFPQGALPVIINRKCSAGSGAFFCNMLKCTRFGTRMYQKWYKEILKYLLTTSVFYSTIRILNTEGAAKMRSACAAPQFLYGGII